MKYQFSLLHLWQGVLNTGDVSLKKIHFLSYHDCLGHSHLKSLKFCSFALEINLKNKIYLYRNSWYNHGTKENKQFFKELQSK